MVSVSQHPVAAPPPGPHSALSRKSDVVKMPTGNVYDVFASEATCKGTRSAAVQCTRFAFQTFSYVRERERERERERDVNN